MFKGLTTLAEKELPIKIMVGAEHLLSEAPELGADETPSGPEQGYTYIKPNVPYCPVVLLGTTEDGGKVYSCLISSVITGLQEYFNLLEILYSLEEKDTIYIYINSPGGLVSTGSAIASLIEECKGKVITCATGVCASAGSLIWSAGHECHAAPFAVFMYHMSSHFAQGNSRMIEQEAAAMVEFVRTVFLRAALEKGHLTEEEVNTISSETDRDVWINAPDMLQRIANGTTPVSEDN